MATPGTALAEVPRIDFRQLHSASAIQLRAEGPGGAHDIRIPVLCWGGGEGPGTLIIAGQHGDEYQGPLILNQILARRGKQLRGNLIIVPAVHPPALAAATRNSPLDGQNLNRIFPGAADGSISERIAHAVATALLPHAEVVLDLHSGGYTTAILPSVMMHYLPDPDLLRRMLAASRGFDLPARVLIDETHKPGMFDTVVEGQGKLFYCPELGGGGLTPRVLQIGYRFVESFLVQFGHLDAPPPARAVRLLEVPDQTFWLKGAADGVFAPAMAPGDPVWRGQLLGDLVSLEEPTRPAQQIVSPHDGVVYMINTGGRMIEGRTVAVIARPAERRFRRM